jgi:hypothetical protein
VMQSARARRESQADPRQPEPVDMSVDPALGVEHAKGLEAGLLRLLERLSPAERAAYILREAFDYTSFGLEEANARQVVTRARQHVAGRRKLPANSTERRRLLAAFIAAAQHGDVASLEATLCSGCGVMSTRRRLPIPIADRGSRHARKHARRTGHPAIASAEEDERWLYRCRDDFLRRVLGRCETLRRSAGDRWQHVATTDATPPAFQERAESSEKQRFREPVPAQMLERAFSPACSACLQCASGQRSGRRLMRAKRRSPIS